MSTNYDRIRANGVELVTGVIGFRWEGAFYPLQPYLAKILTKLLDKGTVYAEEIALRPNTGAVYMSLLRKALREVNLPFTITNHGHGGGYSLEIHTRAEDGQVGEPQYECDHPSNTGFDSLQDSPSGVA